MIRWPKGYRPEETAVHARTELDMPISPEAVWPWLVRAELWPSWCPEFADVVIEGGGPDLKPGSRFRWKTFGVGLDSEVVEFVQFERMAWTARATGIDAYHAWLILRMPDGCCRVITEENQNGVLARLNNELRPRFMGRTQRVWLSRLLEKAEAGPPQGG